jgi:uncharacterized caspase-like protein
MLPPQASALIHGVEREQDALIAELYNGKITFGAFNVGIDRLAGRLADALSGIQKSSEARTASNAEATGNIVQPPLPTSRPNVEQRSASVPAEQFHETRLALVIGNSNYANLPKLSNPTNDARSIADVLQKLGYKTQLLLDASDQKIRSEVRRFASESSKADFALVYYAGHGAQLNGSNYLLPVDIDIPRTEADIQFGGLKLDDLVNSIGSGTKIVFLDACRDNPALFKNIVSGRGSSPVGLAPATASNFTPTKPGGGVFIAYATDAGSVADDGHGAHSPFTAALLRYIQKPVSIDDMFSLVTREVRLVTKNAQRPYKYASLENIVCLPPGCANAPSPIADVFQQARQSESDELQIASKTNNPDALESYLQQYPDTSKRSEILSKIDSLRRAEFTEWTVFELVESKYPQFVKLSSIQQFMDKAAILVRWPVTPSAQQNPVIAAHPGTAYVEDLWVYDCKQPILAIADETLFNAGGQVLYHYKWGDPRYIDLTLGQKLAPGAIGLTSRSIACNRKVTVPAVSKSQLANMNFGLVASTTAGDGEIFYKIIPTKRDNQNERQLVFITKFFSERELNLLPNTSIPDSPKFRTEIDTSIINCKEHRIFAFENEFYSSANELVYLRPPITIPDDINQWLEIKEQSGPVWQLDRAVCNGAEAQQ